MSLKCLSHQRRSYIAASEHGTPKTSAPNGEFSMPSCEPKRKMLTALSQRTQRYWHALTDILIFLTSIFLQSKVLQYCRILEIWQKHNKDKHQQKTTKLTSWSVHHNITVITLTISLLSLQLIESIHSFTVLPPETTVKAMKPCQLGWAWWSSLLHRKTKSSCYGLCSIVLYVIICVKTN